MFSDLSSKSTELEVLVKRVLKVKKEKTIKKKKSLLIINIYYKVTFIIRAVHITLLPTLQELSTLMTSYNRHPE